MNQRRRSLLAIYVEKNPKISKASSCTTEIITATRPFPAPTAITKRKIKLLYICTSDRSTLRTSKSGSSVLFVRRSIWIRTQWWITSHPIPENATMHANSVKNGFPKPPITTSTAGLLILRSMLHWRPANNLNLSLYRTRIEDHFFNVWSSYPSQNSGSKFTVYYTPTPKPLWFHSESILFDGWSKCHYGESPLQYFRKIRSGSFWRDIRFKRDSVKFEFIFQN